VIHFKLFVSGQKFISTFNNQHNSEWNQESALLIKKTWLTNSTLSYETGLSRRLQYTCGYKLGVGSWEWKLHRTFNLRWRRCLKPPEHSRHFVSCRWDEPPCVWRRSGTHRTWRRRWKDWYSCWCTPGRRWSSQTSCCDQWTCRQTRESTRSHLMTNRRRIHSTRSVKSRWRCDWISAWRHFLLEPPEEPITTTNGNDLGTIGLASSPRAPRIAPPNQSSPCSPQYSFPVPLRVGGWVGLSIQYVSNLHKVDCKWPKWISNSRPIVESFSWIPWPFFSYLFFSIDLTTWTILKKM